MLTYDDVKFGTQPCIMNLVKLYPDRYERRDFFSRYDAFIVCDKDNQSIYSIREDFVYYKSEVFIPYKTDPRPPLLLLLGNPASHSIVSEMCFAFEGNGKEHRFWKSLQSADILSFLDLPAIIAGPIVTNQIRRDALRELNYDSPFRIGIAVYYSLPSSASDRKWSGVAGIRKLLGSRAFQVISQLEGKRLDGIISQFIGSTGGIIAFQKDAFDRVRSQDTPTYSRDSANLGILKGYHKSGQHIYLAGAPPTRMALSASGKSAMLIYKQWLVQKLIS